MLCIIKYSGSIGWFWVWCFDQKPNIQTNLKYRILYRGHEAFQIWLEFFFFNDDAWKRYPESILITQQWRYCGEHHYCYPILDKSNIVSEPHTIIYHKCWIFIHVEVSFFFVQFQHKKLIFVLFGNTSIYKRKEKDYDVNT